MRRVLCPLLLAVLLGAAGAPAAEGRVVVGKSIAGIAPGMTDAQVRARLGTPTSARTVPDEVLGQRRELRFGLLAVVLGPVGDDARVLAVRSRTTTERTSRGVTVGTAMSRVKALVPGVRCTRLDARGRHLCTVGRALPGRVLTDFRIGTRGRVVEIAVARVVD